MGDVDYAIDRLEKQYLRLDEEIEGKKKERDGIWRQIWGIQMAELAKRASYIVGKCFKTLDGREYYTKITKLIDTSENNTYECVSVITDEPTEEGLIRIGVTTGHIVKDFQEVSPEEFEKAFNDMITKMRKTVGLKG